MSNEPIKNPFEPLTAMIEAAAVIHEMYISHKEAGFTEDEALKLLVLMMKYA